MKVETPTITVSNRQRARKINLPLLRRIAAALLSDLQIADAALEINLLGAAQMARLNETFLRHAGPTDVITFDYAKRAGRFPGPSQVPGKRGGDRRRAARVLRGEIFVCVDEAVRQARTFRTRWQSELVRYIVHGVLHLTGHDDGGAAARRVMKRAEDRGLRGLARRFSLAEIDAAFKLRP
ncbi:MAG: rRNA maturation RNase YbeY [Verrucomicrobiota bacterium]|nr:rRNA maturation RNase YbeY [Verrucomicrobiota bacterium]